MVQRKVQLIAGTTYTVSLPKDWMKKYSLKEKSLVNIEELGDGSLSLHPSAKIKDRDKEKITLNIDNYGANIDQVIFAAYYLGFENIIISSKESISNDLRSLIKKAVVYMSGTEIIFEDLKQVEIKVLLDMSKINVNQLFFRINIILNATINHIINGLEMKDISRNEEEIDRLYHLVAKMISLSSTNTNTLIESEINKISYILPYFLISKRLENIGDYLNALAKYMKKNDIDAKPFRRILKLIGQRISKYINLLVKKEFELFKEKKYGTLKVLEEDVQKLKNNNIQIYLNNIIRFLGDIEEEIINITFYKRLIEKNIL
ncbi:MAG: hypothetical protein ISS23_00560 [Nanoarchaeota archaeon]|nr:hypothetical protein [Nanoarchaeota archaeon]